jgi:uncharacterized protein YjbI with pentapeptide repeats
MLTIAKKKQFPKTWPALPYKGLSYYEPADAPLFAGRELDVIECADLLARSETRILILHGSTGCGKSSFLRAGLIPYLEHDDLGFGFLKNDADGKLTSIFVRATGNPLVELAKKICDFIKSDIKLKKVDKEEYYSLNLPEIVDKYESETEFIEKVSTDPDLFIKILGEIAVRLPKTLVLIIDQGEEVITLKPNREDDQPMQRFFHFIELFSETCYDLKLLIALRTEFYGRFLGEMYQAQTPMIANYLLGDLTKDQIVTAIERPTSTEHVGDFGIPFEHYRFKYEKGLPEKIATDLLSKKLAGGILPVMQIVCDTLYQNVSSNSGGFLSIEALPAEISEASYRSLGSIEDQIDTSLNATFAHWCKQNDITSEDDIKKETERWKDVLSNLAGSQSDGTVTTDVVTSETLKQWAIEKECILDFAKTIKHLVSPSVRILRDVEFFNTRSDNVVCYSLGHDAIGLALYRWKVIRLDLTNLDLPVKADFTDLFKALAKGVGHTATGKWQELGADAVGALAASGLAMKPGELAFLLIRRSLTIAVFELVGDSASQLSDIAAADANALVDRLDLSIEAKDMSVENKFLDRPGDLAIVNGFKTLLLNWLKRLGIEASAAVAIAGRLPSYFVYALNQEWRRNSNSYGPLLEALSTPFTKAGDREWAWAQYSALLERRIQEPVFGEPFSLSQIFVPLSAYYSKARSSTELEAEVVRDESHTRRHVVIDLHEELARWVDSADPQDAVRVISGGPGSGKSSFARVFASRIAQSNSKIRVLFVPLHLIDASKDLVEEVGRFVSDEGVLLSNPLDPESPEPNLLVIFDGLDELASQGKAAADIARGFVREVEKIVERRNQQAVGLRVLLSGRELVVQENESEFGRPRQILNLLPYFTPLSAEYENDLVVLDGIEYEDPGKLLQKDARQEWWKNYGVLTGKHFEGLPKELNRNDLDEITGQPLLNYLVALSFTRDKLDSSKDINLNSIYADLVTAVHERGYEKRRAYGPIRHMTLDQFSRVLEEIGLAAWHGDGRTTTVREIEEHCKASGVGGLLDAFQEGAKAGVTRLLAAFFFRQYGQRISGEPTFVFTHKSFGEYLAARRVVRAIERVSRELERRASSSDEGWDERDALKHWAQICGPTAMSDYLHTFLMNEVRLRSHIELERWQKQLTRLFNFVLRHAMPMEQLQIATFREAMFQSRNAEESLLVALNVCAQTIGQRSVIQQPDPLTFRTWLMRIDGQRNGISKVARLSLSFLTLRGASLFTTDLIGASLVSSDLEETRGNFLCAGFADLSSANLKKAALPYADFYKSNFSDTNLEGANLRQAYMHMANFARANLIGADLTDADLTDADLTGANLTGANLTGANLTDATLTNANLTDANLTNANLAGTNKKNVKDERTAE